MNTDDPVLGEAAIIEHLRPLTRAPANAGLNAFNLEDDAAILTPRPGFDLVLTTDAVAAGVHFFKDEQPSLIAWRALAVNVSDLAAKGAKPLAYLMALSFPQAPTHAWLADFTTGLTKAQEAFGITLLGGDTDRRPGPLTLNITAIGEVRSGKLVPRGGAKACDRLYASGTLGDASLGLLLRSGGVPTSALITNLPLKHQRNLLDRYARPQPRLGLASALELANASMDISDGLPKDLGRMAKASRVGARIHLAALPLSAAASASLAIDSSLRDLVIAGGDDYEILAAVPQANEAEFRARAEAAHIPVTPIGDVTAGSALLFLDVHGNPVPLTRTGHDHF